MSTEITEDARAVNATLLTEGLARQLSERLEQVAQTDRLQAGSKALYAAVHEVVVKCMGDGDVVILRDVNPEYLSVVTKVVAQVPNAVERRREALTEENLDALVSLYLPHDPLAAGLAEIERDNAEAQASFIETVRCFSADELADLAGSDSSNRSAVANRWKTRKAIFGVKRLGRDRYPAFQFQDGQPRPIIAKALKALPSTMSPWQIAFWFVRSNGWLDGAAPADRLADEKALLAAAAREGDEFVG